eukprot:1365835-Amorphochlora_amoeboformis.AAC.1
MNSFTSSAIHWPRAFSLGRWWWYPLLECRIEVPCGDMVFPPERLESASKSICSTSSPCLDVPFPSTSILSWEAGSGVRGGCACVVWKAMPEVENVGAVVAVDMTVDWLWCGWWTPLYLRSPLLRYDSSVLVQLSVKERKKLWRRASSGVIRSWKL